MKLEKIEGRRNLRARHGSRLTVLSLHIYNESEAKEACWYTWRSLVYPSTSRTLFSCLRYPTANRWPSIGQSSTYCARGGVEPILPWVPHGAQEMCEPESLVIITLSINHVKSPEPANKSNRKAINRNWSNQKANPALKIKTVNK